MSLFSKFSILHLLLITITHYSGCDGACMAPEVASTLYTDSQMPQFSSPKVTLVNGNCRKLEFDCTHGICMDGEKAECREVTRGSGEFRCCCCPVGQNPCRVSYVRYTAVTTGSGSHDTTVGQYNIKNKTVFVTTPTGVKTSNEDHRFTLTPTTTGGMQLQAFFSSTQCGQIGSTSQDGCAVWANETTLQISGRAVDEVVKEMSAERLAGILSKEVIDQIVSLTQ